MGISIGFGLGPVRVSKRLNGRGSAGCLAGLVKLFAAVIVITLLASITAATVLVASVLSLTGLVLAKRPSGARLTAAGRTCWRAAGQMAQGKLK
jgi:hypothetical protein